MTHDEFRDWLKHHLSRFTGAGSWLASFQTEASGARATQAEIRAAWFDCLRHTDLADAKAATDSLFSGEEAFPQQGFDCHPATVRRLARSHARFRKPLVSSAGESWRDGTYKCVLCLDTGLVYVWHPLVVRHARADRDAWLAQGSVYAASVACMCESGDHWHEKYRDEESVRRGMRPLRRYCDSTMPIYPDHFRQSESKQELIAWLDQFGHLAFEQQAQLEFT